MSEHEETAEELAKRLLKIRKAGSAPIIQSLKQKPPPARATPASSAAVPKPENPSKPAAKSPPAKEVDPRDWSEILDDREQWQELGLGNFPFPEHKTFLRLDAQGEPIQYSAKDRARIISSWYVRKDNKYYDINNLGTSLSLADVKQSITHRAKEAFPKQKFDERTLKDLFKTLFDPGANYNPLTSIPVWSGRTASRPGNTQRITFVDGLVEVNTWQTPAYRRFAADGSNQSLGAFGKFLSFILPKEEERKMLLNWLAWNLLHEARKGKWAVFLYSDKQGTGKSTLSVVCKALFGAANTARTNGVSKLVARFNKEILEKKLVIVEEVEVKKGSSQANAIKSLITEDSTAVEAKGQPLETIEHLCCFLMTSNHLPLWLEGADRRFYILNLDHQGYNNGGKDYPEFKRLVTDVYEQIASGAELKGLYQALLSRDLTGFDAMSLDVNTHATNIMKELANLSPDVVKELVEDFLETNGIRFVPQTDALGIITHFAKREANAQTHTFSELGWKKNRFAWGGKSQRWAWHHPDYKPEQGKIRAIIHVEDDLGKIHDHLAATLYPAMKRLLGRENNDNESSG